VGRVVGEGGGSYAIEGVGIRVDTVLDDGRLGVMELRVNGAVWSVVGGGAVVTVSNG